MYLCFERFNLKNGLRTLNFSFSFFVVCAIVPAIFVQSYFRTYQGRCTSTNSQRIREVNDVMLFVVMNMMTLSLDVPRASQLLGLSEEECVKREYSGLLR
jgi:hypothetical protein